MESNFRYWLYSFMGGSGIAFMVVKTWPMAFAFVAMFALALAYEAIYAYFAHSVSKSQLMEAEKSFKDYASQLNNLTKEIEKLKVAESTRALARVTGRG
jgi:hypothetical protein